MVEDKKDKPWLDPEKRKVFEFVLFKAMEAYDAQKSYEQESNDSHPPPFGDKAERRR